MLGFANEVLVSILKAPPCGWVTSVGNIEKINVQFDLLRNALSEIEKAGKTVFQFASASIF